MIVMREGGEEGGMTFIECLLCTGSDLGTSHLVTQSTVIPCAVVLTE